MGGWNVSIAFIYWYNKTAAPLKLETQEGITGTSEHISTVQQRLELAVHASALKRNHPEWVQGCDNTATPLWPSASRVGSAGPGSLTCPCLFLLEELCSVPVLPWRCAGCHLVSCSARFRTSQWHIWTVLVLWEPPVTHHTCNFMTSLCLEISALILSLQTTAACDSHSVSISSSKMNQLIDDGSRQNARPNSELTGGNGMSLGVNLWADYPLM